MSEEEKCGGERAHAESYAPSGAVFRCRKSAPVRRRGSIDGIHPDMRAHKTRKGFGRTAVDGEDLVRTVPMTPWP
jgi:hypothetical protein